MSTSDPDFSQFSLLWLLRNKWVVVGGSLQVCFFEALAWPAGIVVVMDQTRALPGLRNVIK